VPRRATGNVDRRHNRRQCPLNRRALVVVARPQSGSYVTAKRCSTLALPTTSGAGRRALHNVDQRYRCGAASTRIEPSARAAWFRLLRFGRIAIKVPPTTVATGRLMTVRGCARNSETGNARGGARCRAVTFSSRPRHRSLTLALTVVANVAIRW
jgi:hypothetical protein